MQDRIRCPWCLKDDLYRNYHDFEWGVPERDSLALFEKLCLDGAQAGLSWYTILSKREGYRQAFDGFDPERMARYGEDRVQALMQDSRIVRNRQKINAFIANAQAWIRIGETVPGGFSSFLWQFTGGETLVNHWTHSSEVPASTPLSDQVSRALQQHGFKFAGTTIVYAFMQAVGMVDDHLLSCWRRTAAASGI